MNRRERYLRQEAFKPIGPKGQEKLRNARVAVVGCGALGSGVVANLGRAGVGYIRIVDRDALDITNLQRQNLFTEADCEERLPKAVAAAKRLREINSEVETEPHVAHVQPDNVLDMVADVDIVVDGTDNVETRYLLNDACVKAGLPWIYGGAVGSQGLAMTVLPGRSACLRCVFEEAPPPGLLPTCHTIGVLNTITAAIGSIQATEAIKLLVGYSEGDIGLVQIDIWRGSFRTTPVARREECPACVLHRFDFLRAGQASSTAIVGRNAIQFVPSPPMSIDLTELAARLSRSGEARYNGFLVVANRESVVMTIFPDGRVLVEGTTDEPFARELIRKYVGT